MSSRFKRWLLYGVTPFLIILVVYVVLVLRSDNPPITEMDKARRKIAEAEYNWSSKYAKELFQNAKVYYDTAILAWQNENLRWILLRDYSRVRNYASLSYTYAEKAMNLSRERINATEELLNFRISLLETRLKNLLGKYGKVPLDAERQNHYRKSEMLLTEGRYAYKQGNYQSAKEKLDISETMIQELSEYYEDILFQYFGQRPQWNQWIDFVVRDSRRNQTACVVIDKIARKCILYKNGKAVNTFDAELGSNWIGDKSQQGDKTTPEGLYKIELKKAGGETRYYKALLLDYPNEEDKKRFILNKRNNVIRQDAKIGSLIEIHGGGGKGIDWTDGCIALKDADMDILFEACRVGSRVAIVGSIKSFEELFNLSQ